MINRMKTLATAALTFTVALPVLAARGSADFTRYVAIGDSFGMGVSNASIVMTHQQHGYPAVIARQAGSPDFQQPLVSEPGITPELQLTSLIPRPVIAPKASANGVPINLNLPRPYNNLSVAGFAVHDALTVTGREPNAGAAAFVLRGLGTQVQQAAALQPTFISVWLGGNDVLGAVLAGTPAVMTPISSFITDYTTLLDSLIAAAPNAGIITGTIPDPTVVAYAHALPPVLTDQTGAPVTVGGQFIPLFADLGGGQLGVLPPGSLVLLSASAYLPTGYGIPPTIASNFPQLPNAGRPLPDTAVLTPAEIAAIRTRAQQINDAIRTTAAQRQIPVVDLVSEFADVEEGIDMAGVTLTSAYLTGGIFGYDGFHLTDIGYTIFANAFIRKINQEWDEDIPQASILPFFENNAAGTSDALLIRPGSFTFTNAALRSLKWIYGLGPAPKGTRTKGRLK